MKKLKRFVLNTAQCLSNEEMASIEGMDVHAVDECTSNNQACVYSVSYNGSHSVVTIGVCKSHTMVTEDGFVKTYFTCE